MGLTIYDLMIKKSFRERNFKLHLGVDIFKKLIAEITPAWNQIKNKKNKLITLVQLTNLEKEVNEESSGDNLFYNSKVERKNKNVLITH